MTRAGLPALVIIKRRQTHGPSIREEDSLQQDVTLKVQEIDAALEEETFGSTQGAPKNFITPKGFEKLKADLNHLEQIERPALIEKKSSQVQIDELIGRSIHFSGI